MKSTKKAFILGKGYTHFAICKSTNLILNGWDYKNYEQTELTSEKDYYFFQDLTDMFDGGVDKKDVKILTRISVEKLNIVITELLICLEQVDFSILNYIS